MGYSSDEESRFVTEPVVQENHGLAPGPTISHAFEHFLIQSLNLKFDCSAITISVKIFSCLTILTLSDQIIPRDDRPWSLGQADF